MASHDRDKDRGRERDRYMDSRRASRPSRNSQSSVRSATVSSGHSGVLMVGPNFRVGKKIGCGNFGELRLGEWEGGREILSNRFMIEAHTCIYMYSGTSE